jgi:hypothetical protein
MELLWFRTDRQRIPAYRLSAAGQVVVQLGLSSTMHREAVVQMRNAMAKGGDKMAESRKVVCGECGREHSGDGWLYLHSKCHIDAPTWARLDQHRGLVEIFCAVCNQIIVRFTINTVERGEGHAE